MNKYLVKTGTRRVLLWFLAFGYMTAVPLECGDHGPGTLGVTYAAAEERVQKPALEDVAGDLICDNPACSKESLRECTTCEYAVKHRTEIGKQISEGRTREQIINWFGDTYGEHLLGNPRAKMAAGVPLAAVLLGLIPLTLVLRSRNRGKRSAAQSEPAIRTPSPSNPSSTPEDPRIAEALDNFDY